VAALRIVGERALAKMSAYDLVVTVALGSVLASIPLQPSITLADGLAAILTLLALQYAISWTIKRSSSAKKLVKGRPVLVLYDGRMLEDRMLAISVTDDEVRAAARSHGMGSLDECLAIVLENDGNWSVVGHGDRDNLSALEDLDIPAVPARRSPQPARSPAPHASPDRLT
jgi:uncharacterized membrane protein YcaP (DUF421 family)